MKNPVWVCPIGPPRWSALLDLFCDGSACRSPALGWWLPLLLGETNNPLDELFTLPLPLQIVSIGDLCVTPFSLAADCREASWGQVAAGYPDVCTLPQQSAPPNASSLFGECLFSQAAPGSLALAQELNGVARAAAVAGAYPTQ